MKTFADFGIDLPHGAHGEIDVLCPTCSPTRRKSRDRCLSVNVEKGTWLCMHCGWSGGLGGAKDGPAPYGTAPPKTYQRPRPVPESIAPDVWANAVRWFAEERGIGEAVLHRNRIAAAREYCPVCDAEVGHILFPYERDGIHVNTKHRCGKKHFRMEKGAERIFYGLDDVTGADTIIIVEGEIDKLSLEVAGFTNVLSVPDGAPAPDAAAYTSKFTFLESAESVFSQARRIILAPDADAPGQKLLDELARRIGPEKCSRVLWPDGIKDANDALIQAGPTYLAACIEDAAPFPVEGLITGDDWSHDLTHLYQHGFDRGVESGYLNLDKLYRVRPGLMTVVTGIPGHGKSHFLDQLLIKLAVRHGWTFGVCSPENQPVHRHVASLISVYTGKPFHDGPTPRITPDELRWADAWIGRHFAFILPEEPTVEAILHRARILVYRMGIKGLVIDPWNEIEHSRPASKTETEYISECLGALRRFARHHDLHLWLVAHPTKLKKTDDKIEPLPGLWDISGSAHFRNKADAGISIWRDLTNRDEPVQVHIQKIRFSETGEEGHALFTYDRATGCYHEVRA
jgi:twinkle protein